MLSIRQDRTKCFEVRRNREGIALVVVLGFLAVLTIMAVGMAISMRTERLASGSHLDMVKARMYCNAALADSMMWVEDYLATQKEEYKDYVAAPYFKEVAVYWQDRGLQTPGEQWTGGQGRVLPSRDPESNGDTFATSLADGIGTNFALYVDSVVWRNLPKDKEDVESLGAQWIHVEDSGGKLVGRYMYLIVADTVQIDLNYQHREIVPGFRLGGDSDLFDDRISYPIEEIYSERDDKHIRYETVRDFFNAHEDIEREYEHGSYGGHNTGMFFNYAPPMRPVRVVREEGRNVVEFLEDYSYRPVDIRGDVGDWQDLQDDIEYAFRTARSSSLWQTAEGSASAEDLYWLLRDYADSDYTPADGNLQRASIEPVPMINEVRLEAERVGVEVWAPFVGNTHYTGDFQVRAEIDGGEHDSPSGNLPDWTIPVEPGRPQTIAIDLAPEDSLTNSVYDIKLSVISGAGVLDEVSLHDIEVGKYSQCDDPRFNHEESQWQKNSIEGTLGDINNNAGYADNGENPAGSYVRDGDYHMYCANGPLNATGDLGYLPVAPWRTLKLYEDMRNNSVDMDPVLNYFTMQTDVVMGKINPQVATLWARALDTVFDTYNQVEGGYLGMYHDDTDNSYRGGSFLHKECMAPYVSNYERHHGFAMNFRTLFLWNSDATLNMADFGKKLFSNKAGHGVPGIKPIKRLVDFKNRSRTDPQYSELRLEHLMRRASALVNLRQNRLMVCLWAQTVGPEPQEAGKPHSYPVLSEAQAIALVWRDPYPDENGQHRKFVRFMRWME